MITLEKRLAARARDKKPSPIRELMPYLNIDGMISLGGGYPNPQTFLLQSLELSFQDAPAVQLQGPQLTQACQYGPSAAEPQLLERLLQWQAFKDNQSLEKNQIVVLNGSQEGLFIMSYLFLEAQDSVVVSEPCYPGAIAAFSSFSRNFLPIPLDDQGLQTTILEEKLRQLRQQGQTLPKFICTVPHGHNPAGVSLSLTRRRHLLELAHEFDLLILEDDPYQLLQLQPQQKLPTLQALEQEPCRVVRLDSFSKIFAPGLRLGYASGPAAIMRLFVLTKQALNLHTSSFAQVVLAHFFKTLSNPEFASLIQRHCQLYRRNRDAMVAAAQEFLPAQVRFQVPSQGMFIWFRLPTGYNSQRMIEQDAADLKVLLVPGSAFSLTQGCQNAMRASFSLVSPTAIREGMQRFAQMLKREKARQEATAQDV